jgi:hypothetical protein
MTHDQMTEARFQLRLRQVIGGVLLTGIVGGSLTLAASALAGSAFVAVRRRLEQMDAPPSAVARQHLARAKAATVAGLAASGTLDDPGHSVHGRKRA